jgi:ADP-heptose:LPS heptosyltransferase/GT2 family glycosyltransferase
MPPRCALFLRPDTLGDLVLFAPTLCCLRAAWPQARIAVLIRRPYLELAPALVPGLEWIATRIDPFAQGPADAAAELASLRQTVAALAPDLVVAACPRRNWLETALAAGVPQARRVALGTAEEDAYFGTQLRLQLGTTSAATFPEIADVAGYAQDWQRGYCLADHLLGTKVERVPPALKLEAATLRAADEILRQRGLEPGRYVACAAAGFANVRLKTWPADRFGATLAWLRQQHGLPALLVGQESERTYLESVRAAAGAAAPAIWRGRESELPLLAGLLERAALYFGNDTGAMHLAAALGRPIVAVFGGGTWPRFQPAARQAIALVHPLPCFGCGWDCPFGDAPCLLAVGVPDAQQALDEALRRRDAPFHEVRELRTIPAATVALMGQTARLAREQTAAHLARQKKLEEITFLAGEKDGEIAALKRETDAKDREIAALKRETDAKDREIADLKRIADERLRETDAKQEEIATLLTACQERLDLINSLGRQIQGMQGEAMQRDAALAATKAELADAQHRADETETFYRRLAPDAAQWAQQLADAQARASALQADLTARQAELQTLQTTLREREASLQNFVNGLGALEVNKLYQRLLREKENVLQALHHACQEREAVIRQLAAGSTRPTAWLHQFGLAGAAWWRARIATPLRTGLDRRLLEGFWMQLGTLHQYAPRPIVWDRGVSRARPAGSPALKIGIVTPSYNQVAYLERTMRSVLDQQYPDLFYVVQDGASTDGSPAIIRRYAAQLHASESAPDQGQADAIRKGFDRLTGALGPDDVMAWLNSDDLLAPGALAFVARYFAAHPRVDAIYGHRIIINPGDREIGRWVLPRHRPETLRWIDFVPQETLFWRKRAWDLVGGIDPSFHFALDWDLLLRLQEIGRRIERVPYFLGAFRVHDEQKTSAQIHTQGHDEMQRVRTRLHGATPDHSRLDRETRRTQLRGAIAARLLELGVRW